MAPVGILILMLTGLGPLLAWRNTSWRSLWINARLPLVACVVAGAAAFQIAGGTTLEWTLNRIMAIITFGIAAFVITGVMEEWLKAAVARRKYSGEILIVAIILVLFQNKRRFLGYMVHISLAILFSGFAGLAFGTEGRLILRPGEAEAFAGYTIHVENYEEKGEPAGARVPLYGTRMVTIAVYRDNVLIGRDTTEIRTYPMYNFREGRYSDTQNTSEPAIISKPFQDIYLQLGGDEKGRLVMQVWINPLVRWVWSGFAFFVAMGLLLLLPIGEGRFLFYKKFRILPEAQS
jgi:cytochrome c-type biogenesis protein CcmF